MSYVPSFSPGAIAERKTWQFRAIEHTKGNTTQLGAFIIAMLGRRCKPPCFSPAGILITKEGCIMALYDRGYGWGIARAYESVEAMNVAFRTLAHELKLSEADTVALFEELRKFVRKDQRAVSNIG